MIPGQCQEVTKSHDKLAGNMITWCDYPFIIALSGQHNSLVACFQMLQIQLQMVQQGATALATNNEKAEQAKNEWSGIYGEVWSW